MERHTISIEPYIDASGIMSGEIELDAKAADSVMKRTALRRDVLVVRGYGRDQYRAVGSEELAIEVSKAKPLDGDVEKSKRSTLEKTPNAFVIRIHDQQIQDEVNDWGRENYRSHNGKTQIEVEREEFVKIMRRGVAVGIRDATWDEKKEVLITSTGNFLKLSPLYVGILGAMYGWSYAFRELTKHTYTGSSEFPLEEVLVFSASTLFLRFGIQLSLSLTEDGFPGIHNFPTRPIEIILPNPQIPSIALGSVSLALNSGRLIRLKKK